MAIFKDGNGDDLEYVPITGLATGQSTDPIPFTFDTPQTGMLTSNLDDNVIVWVRLVSEGIWYDIASDPIDTSLINEGVDTEFEFKVEALAPITGLYRCPMAVVLGVSLPSGWAV